MRRTASPLGSLLLFAGLAVAVSGCEVMADPEFAALKNALTLRIVAAKRNASGGITDFSLELTNRGSTSAKACLGPSRSVSYKVASSSGTSSTFVDHPGCGDRSQVEPIRDPMKRPNQRKRAAFGDCGTIRAAGRRALCAVR